MNLISLKELFIYLRGIRCLEEGERAFNAKHIMYCAITKQSTDLIEILFLCLRSSNLFGKPAEILVTIKNPNNNNKFSVQVVSRHSKDSKCMHMELVRKLLTGGATCGLT